MTYTANNLMQSFSGGGTNAAYACDGDDWRVKKVINGGAPVYSLRGPAASC